MIEGVTRERWRERERECVCIFRGKIKRQRRIYGYKGAKKERWKDIAT